MKSRTLSLMVAALAAFAASAALAAGAGATAPQAVTLRLDGVLDPATLTVTGTWMATGAVADSGTYHEEVVLDGHSIHLTKQLHGGEGDIVLVARAVMDVSADGIATFRAGSWRFVCGTGAYQTLQGGGSPAATADSFGSFVTGQVHIVHVGEAHYDGVAAEASACDAATP
jgi:hypothetical protein